MTARSRWKGLALWLLVPAASLLPLLVVIQSWSGGKPLAYALGGFFPLTDSALWWGCSVQLGALGSMPGPFGWVAFDSSGYCTNRPSHAALLATLQIFAGYDPAVLLLLLALVVGVCLAYFSLEVGRTFGWLSGSVAYVLAFAYASQHVLSMFTSESSGFFLGSLGLAFLVRFVRTDAWADAWIGIAILSIAIFTRAGAMLALPLLLVWAVRQARLQPQGRPRRVFLLAGMASIAAGLMLQRTLIALVGDAPGGYFSNFSVVLYGLATGSRDWREVLVLYGVETPAPVETMNMILPLALAKIWEQPGTFLLALASAERDYLATLFQVPPLTALELPLMALLLAGVLIAVGRIRRRGYQALALVALGEALSAPLVFDADGLRVFAATFAVRCLFVAVAISASVGLLMAALRRQPIRPALAPAVASAPASSAGWRTPGMALAAVVLAALFPATPFAHPFRLGPIPVADVTCPDGFDPVVLVVNRASISFLIDGKSAASAGIIPPELLESELRGLWFGSDFVQLPHNTRLLRAINRHPENFGREVSVLWMNTDATVRDGDILRMCLLPHWTRAPHRRHIRLSYHRFLFASPVYRTEAPR